MAFLGCGFALASDAGIDEAHGIELFINPDGHDVDVLRSIGILSEAYALAGALDPFFVGIAFVFFSCDHNWIISSKSPHKSPLGYKLGWLEIFFESLSHENPRPQGIQAKL
jgi:hypothetical protein